MAKNSKKAALKSGTAGMSIDASKYNYTKTKVMGADGKARVRTGNGDAVAQAFAHLHTPEDFAKVAKANKLTPGGVNAGQIRMNLGNMLRGRIRKGEPMVIGALTIKSLDQKVPVPEGVKAAAQATAQRQKEMELGKRAAAASGAVRATTGNRGSKTASRGKSSATQKGGNTSTSQTA